MTTNNELIERLRVLEQDHKPDGWPAIQMRDVTALLDTIETQAKQIEALKADVNSMIKAPARWLPAEIEDGHRGIRWVMSDGVYGVPTVSDYISYMEMIGRRWEIDTWLAQKGGA